MPEKIRQLLTSLLTLILLIGPGIAQETLPVKIAEQQWRPLLQCVDNDFQVALQKRIEQNSHWSSLIKNNRMSVGLVDLSVPDAPHFAAINGDFMMYAASLPKIAVLLAASQAFEEQKLLESETVVQDVRRMIRRSDNAAATRLIDALGYQYIAGVLTDEHYRFYDQNRGGGLWVGKRYARSGARSPDPIKGISHAASVNQVCRFYYLLATDRLLNEKRNQEMLAHLSDTAIPHKFVHALNHLAPDAKLYRKSGTWRSWHADSVLVIGPDWRRYILVALLEDSSGEQCLRDLVPVVESVLHPTAL